tara:strand:- start:106 stop:996 length:891 start_codon:yes stop_codon:yes gene_type:complete
MEISTTEPMVNEYSNLDFDDIQYNHPVERNNCKYIDILHRNQDILTFHTPQLTVHKVIHKSDTQKYIDLIIDEKNKSFFEFIANIDDHNMLNIYNNSNRWFKKNIPLDILDDFHNPVMKMTKKGNAIFRTQYTDDKLDEIKQGDIAEFTIKLDSIKLYRKEFTTQWVLLDHNTDNVEYEFGDDMLECQSNYDFGDEESDVEENESESSHSSEDEDENSEYGGDENLEGLNELSELNKMNISRNQNEIQSIRNRPSISNDLNHRRESDSVSIRSDSTRKSYKKKRIIYANKEKIWNN